MKLGWMAALAMMTVTAAAPAARGAEEIPIKDKDGKTYGVIVLCNDCETGSKKGCNAGAEEGWLNGKPCGKCFLPPNKGTPEWPYDVHIIGTLTDEAGKPIKDRFVKLFLPNGWGHRTRTYEKGTFRLMLGATAERKSKEPLEIDIGTRVDSQRGADPYFALFVLPQSYKPCAAASAPAHPEKQNGKKH